MSSWVTVRQSLGPISSPSRACIPSTPCASTVAIDRRLPQQCGQLVRPRGSDEIPRVAATPFRDVTNLSRAFFVSVVFGLGDHSGGYRALDAPVGLCIVGGR